MSKHVPDTAVANAALGTAREASRRDHKPYQVRHLDEIEWETIRWPGETGKMLFHPRPEDPTQPNAGILRLEPGAYHPEHREAARLEGWATNAVLVPMLRDGCSAPSSA